MFGLDIQYIKNGWNMKNANKDVEKMTVVFPTSVVQNLRQRIPPRRRSAFVVEAVTEKLALEEQLAAIEESAGAWSQENHPELATDQAVDRWLAELRQLWAGVQDGTASKIHP
jgi:hypothetical protein